MAIPLYCAECGQYVGMRGGLALLGNIDSRVSIPCPGRGQHAEPERSEKIHCDGLLRRVWVFYPETMSESSWDEYIGPADLKTLKRAITKGTYRNSNGSYDGVTVNGKWAWYKRAGRFRGELYGDGVVELKKQLQSHTT